MKKPITIGVIAVIATILVTNAVDFSADAIKPIMPPQSVACPVGNSKIVTSYEVRPGIDIQHATEPTVEDGFRFLVTTIRDVDDVIDVTGPDVVNRLNELGYFVDDGSVRDVNIGDISPPFIEGTNPFCMES